MFFRFYILAVICSLAVLPTSVWVVGAAILLWLISIPTQGISRYREWKKYQAILYHKTLSFCIKSMRRQKQNFKVIEYLIRNKNLQKRFKKLSILLDDINIKVTSGYVEDLPQTSDHLDPHIYHHSYRHDHSMNDMYYSPSYSHYSCNTHHRSDRNH